MQDASKDTAAGFLACQTSTAGVLAAVRKAYTARHNILEHAPAVRVETVRLPKQECLGAREWGYLACSEMSFSCCGRWLAVVLWGRTSCSTAEESIGLPSKLFEVVLYSVSGQVQQRDRVCTLSSQPTIQWAKAAPHLCVAMAPAYRAPTQQPQSHTQDLSAQPGGLAAFVVDARTGSRIHALSPAVAAVSQLPKDWRPTIMQKLSWLPRSTSCLLLVQWRQRTTDQGMVSAFDIEAGQAMAGSLITTSGQSMGAGRAAAWLPSMQPGIVLPAAMALQQSDSFRQAGIAVGNLPDPYSHDSRAGFSSDGKYLVAWSGGLFSGADANTSALFSCSLRGLQICFTLEHVFGPGALRFCWVPGMPCLYIQERPSEFSDNSYNKVVTLPIGCQPDRFLVASSNAAFGHLSPSGRLLVGKGPGGFALVDLESGRPVWDATKEPAWEMQTKLGRIRALRGEPLGTGLGSRLDFCAWSPTGASFVCQVSLPREGGVRPPMLRMYWLA